MLKLMYVTSKAAYHRVCVQLETVPVDTKCTNTRQNLKSSLMCSSTTRDVIKIRNMGSRTAPTWFVDFIAT